MYINYAVKKNPHGLVGNVLDYDIVMFLLVMFYANFASWQHWVSAVQEMIRSERGIFFMVRSSTR